MQGPLGGRAHRSYGALLLAISPDQQIHIAADCEIAQMPVRACECHEQAAKAGVDGDCFGRRIVVLVDLQRGSRHSQFVYVSFTQW